MRAAALLFVAACVLSLVACPGLPTATPFPEQVSTEQPVQSIPDASATPHDTAERPAQPATATETRIALEAYAADYAGGPGAIYVGILEQLAGPALLSEHGDLQGNVPLSALEEFRFVYESDYYQDLLRRSRFTDPTRITSQLDSPIFILHACVNGDSMWCQLMEAYLAPNLERRTGGMLTIEVAPFFELGILPNDALDLLEDGTLGMAEIYGLPLGGDLPELEILFLYGLYSDHSQYFQAAVEMLPDIERLLEVATGGYPLGVNWLSGHSPYLVGTARLEHPEDFKGLETYAFSKPVSDWLRGMGADPYFVPGTEVHTVLERGILDAAAAPPDYSYRQRWYEVTDYISGPLVSWSPSHYAVSRDVWESLPADLQEIMKEEAARLELEALRTAPAYIARVLQNNVDSGLTHAEFSPEVQAQSEWAAMNHVVPNWVERIGGPDSPFADLFNRVHGPLLGLRIEADGSVEKFR